MYMPRKKEPRAGAKLHEQNAQKTPVAEVSSDRQFEFQINEVYRQEVVRLLSARKKSKLIHASGDIDASGDEIEVPFRDFLRRRLPSQYFVGHGHIVDSSLNVSPQYDVIIADNNSTPILFEAENGCQYFPYESVYALGEIKSTYRKQRSPIKNFASNVQKLKDVLKREPTPPNYIGNGITLGTGFTNNEKRPYTNPLFQFMIFFDSGDATRPALANEYCSNADENLPIISVFLDGKIIVKAELNEISGETEMGKIDLDPVRILSRRDLEWMYVNYKDKSNSGSQAIVAFMLGIFNHLNSCTLMDPPIREYLHKVLAVAPHQPEALSLGAVTKMIKARGFELPKGFVDFLEFRQRKGISAVNRLGKAELEEYITHLGEKASSFIAEMEEFMRKAGGVIPEKYFRGGSRNRRKH